MKSDRRAFLRASLATGAAAAFAPTCLWAAPGAATLYADSIVIDGMGPPGDGEDDPDGPLSDASLAHLAASGLSATHFPVGTVGTMPPLQAFERVVRSIARWERRIDLAPRVHPRVAGVLGGNLLRVFGDSWGKGRA